jgi:hypothetical protein
LSDHDPNAHANQRIPSAIPILHGPITPEEQLAQEREDDRKAREKSDHAFQERQVTAVEAANKIASRNTLLTGVAAIISALAFGGILYQAHISRLNRETAQNTLEQIKNDALTSSQQFQVQLGHFDAGIGRTELLAQHAGEQVGKLQAQTEALDRNRRAADKNAADALNVTNDNFRQEQRPWVGLAEPIKLTNITIGPHVQIEYSTKIKNFGTSPSFEVIPRIDVVAGDRSMNGVPIMEQVCHEVETGLLPLKVGEVIFPGDTYTFPTSGEPHSGHPQITTSPSDPIYYFVGCIVYMDSTNRTHHTGVCQWTDKDNFRVGSTFSSCSRPFAD